MTSSKVVLLAAYRIATRTGEPRLDLATLVVEAWRLDRARFGLPGHEQCYPHSNRVIVELVRTRSVCAKGWLRRLSPKLYCLTESGSALAAELDRTKRASS